MTAKKDVHTATIQEQILTVEKASEILSLTERTLRDKVNKGEIKGYKKAGRVYILFSDIVTWVKS